MGAGFEAKAKSPGSFPQGLVILQGEFGYRLLPVAPTLQPPAVRQRFTA